MNIFAIIILAAILLEYALQLAADYFNLKTLRAEVPKEFAGVYNEAAYGKSQAYTKTNTTFGIFTATVNLAVILTFWFSGGFNYIDVIVRRWNFGFLWTGLLFIGLLMLLKSILSLPFSIYSTFVIEERFGFNKTTVKTFASDLIKGLILAVVLGGPLAAAILAFFSFAGPLAWFYCWIATAVFILLVQFIAPTWIMPLFNKFTPLGDGELRTAILDYARSVSFPLKGIFVMDGSKRSGKSNAFFTGFGKNKRIALFDTLIAKHTVAELVAVLAHEIGHYKKKHIVQSIVISIAHMGLMFFLLSFFITTRGLFDAFYMQDISVYAGLIFFGMLYSPIELILSLAMHLLSRKNEYEADRFAADTIQRPESMIDALKKLSVDNLSNLTPHPFYVFLNYSHPPVLQRIQAIRQPVAVTDTTHD
ncbi:MAG: M48 family metallopeptidase [Bacteroidota bacterium]